MKVKFIFETLEFVIIKMNVVNYCPSLNSLEERLRYVSTAFGAVGNLGTGGET